MSYKIVLDSCGELPEHLKSDNRYEIVPLELQVGEERMWDDETFDQKNFLQKVAACPTCPKSACPSPERYMQAFDCAAEDIYVVTLSGNLSGSYNSAYLARSMYLEKIRTRKSMYLIPVPHPVVRHRLHFISAALQKRENPSKRSFRWQSSSEMI